MIYTAMTKTAMRIAYDAHQGQLDRAGLPFIFHPFHLAGQMGDEVSSAAALLHDVLEKTPLTRDSLRSQGISDEVLDIVALLTHDPAVPYMDYVQQIKDSANPRAIAVKLADLRHNSDASRYDALDDQDRARMQKYAVAIQLLGG